MQSIILGRQNSGILTFCDKIVFTVGDVRKYQLILQKVSRWNGPLLDQGGNLLISKEQRQQQKMKGDEVAVMEIILKDSLSL